MSFRNREMMNKIIRRVGRHNLAPGVEESLKKCIPNRKIVMGRAERGLFAGHHIRSGNQISETGGNKSRRFWKPNVFNKRLFSYILDRFIQVKVTSHALHCIDKVGGIDEYLLKTPYHKMDTELGLFWKAKIEKLYEELGQMNVAFFSPEDEAKLKDDLKDASFANVKACEEQQKILISPAKEKGEKKEICCVSYVLATADDHPGKIVANF